VRSKELRMTILFVGAILAVALNARLTGRGEPYPYKNIFNIAKLIMKQVQDNNTFSHAEPVSASML